MYRVTVVQYDTEYDTDQPSWIGVVIADGTYSAGTLALESAGKAAEGYSRDVLTVTELGEAAPELTAGVVSGEWGW